MRTRSIVAACTAFLLGSCTIHPLPEDVTGLNTQTIVHQIRCETRNAIIEIGFQWLLQRDPETVRIASEYRNDPSKLKNFHYNFFKGETRRILQLFFDTGVAYNYNLTMTENNAASAGFDLLKPYANGTGTFGLGGAATLQRQNLRTFTITDSFSKLIREIPPDRCGQQNAERNFVYPIAGQIGIEPVIRTFVDLTLFERLGGDKDKQGPPAMAEALTFQTTLSINGGPKFLFTPAGRSLNLADANLGLSASRSDTHNLIVGLSLPPDKKRLIEGLQGKVVTPLLLSAQGEPSQLYAALAANQVKVERSFNPYYLYGP